MSFSSEAIIAGVAATAITGVITAIFTYKIKGKKKTPEEPKKFERKEEENQSQNQSQNQNQEEVYKMALIVRGDLKMGKGKIGAQCGHASLGAYKTTKKRDPAAIGIWESQGRKKEVFKINSEEEL